MLIGPVFTREAIVAPRRLRFYVFRTTYALTLLLMICTAWMVLTGSQVVRNISDMAAFGASLFQILAPLQMAILIFISAIQSASAVAVLHAITTCFGRIGSRYPTICFTNVVTVAGDLLPYGSRAVSPKYRMSSCGRTLRSRRTTVSPPRPESSTTIGEVGDNGVRPTGRDLRHGRSTEPGTFPRSIGPTRGYRTLPGLS